MTLGSVIPEGVIIAADSRQTSTRSGITRISSDSASKVFQLTDTVAAATAGFAFLWPQGAATMRNIASLAA